MTGKKSVDVGVSRGFNNSALVLDKRALTLIGVFASLADASSCFARQVHLLLDGENLKILIRGVAKAQLDQILKNPWAKKLAVSLGAQVSFLPFNHEREACVFNFSTHGFSHAAVEDEPSLFDSAEIAIPVKLQ